MKKIYNYNKDTKVFTGESLIYSDDFGGYNIPAFSTYIQPETPENHIAVFKNNIWEYVRNYKFSYVVDTDGFVTSNNIGETIFTDEECPNKRLYKYDGEKWVKDLEKELILCKNDLIYKIEDVYKSISETGFKYGEHTFYCSQTTINNINTLVSNVKNMEEDGIVINTTDIIFFDKYYTPCVFSNTQEFKMFKINITRYVDALQKNKLILINSVLSATTKEDLSNVDITIGWPQQ